jgi:hypothetical protein
LKEKFVKKCKETPIDKYSTEIISRFAETPFAKKKFEGV